VDFTINPYIYRKANDKTVALKNGNLNAVLRVLQRTRNERVGKEYDYCNAGVGVASSVLAIAVSLSSTGMGAILLFLLSRPSSTSGTD
jgi:hypothetical protein